MKIKTSELIGKPLNFAVALANGLEIDETHEPIWFDDDGEYETYSPSTNWAHGGSIIERAMLGIMPVSDAWWRAGDVDGANGFGPTPLIAAMRCFVASELGDEVDVPGALV